MRILQRYALRQFVPPFFLAPIGLQNMQASLRVKVHCKLVAQDPAQPTTLEETDKASGSLVLRKSRYEPVRYRFDSLLTPEMSLYEVFHALGRKSVKRFVQGYSVGLLTYGQAGVGKTHSLFGGSVARGSPGLVQQTLEDIFARTGRDKANIYRLSLVAIATHQDKSADLLASKRSPKSDAAVTLSSAVCVEVQGVAHAMGLLAE